MLNFELDRAVPVSPLADVVHTKGRRRRRRVKSCLVYCGRDVLRDDGAVVGDSGDLTGVTFMMVLWQTPNTGV